MNISHSERNVNRECRLFSHNKKNSSSRVSSERSMGRCANLLSCHHHPSVDNDYENINAVWIKCGLDGDDNVGVGDDEATQRYQMSEWV